MNSVCSPGRTDAVILVSTRDWLQKSHLHVFSTGAVFSQIVLFSGFGESTAVFVYSFSGIVPKYLENIDLNP